jgi:YopX protein
MQGGREIKFQVWDQNAKEMWTWEDINIADKEGIMCFLDMLQQDQFIPRQFVGCHDKNGKEVYSGDLWIPSGTDNPYLVKWGKAGWWLYNPRNDMYWSPADELEHGEVIGNIYEHPELLQVG